PRTGHVGTGYQRKSSVREIPPDPVRRIGGHQINHPYAVTGGQIPDGRIELVGAFLGEVLSDLRSESARHRDFAKVVGDSAVCGVAKVLNPEANLDWVGEEGVYVCVGQRDREGNRAGAGRGQCAVGTAEEYQRPRSGQNRIRTSQFYPAACSLV